MQGDTIQLKRADDVAEGANHSFAAGLTAINGGEMNCFERLQAGENLEGYVQYHREDISNY